MSPIEYEHVVAEVLRREGWIATVTPPTADGGIDVIAQRNGTRLGVQVKMYGSGSRRINAQIVHELYGAATCEDCTEMMIATDGAVRPDAQAAADRLGVRIRIIPAMAGDGRGRCGSHQQLDFDAVWTRYVSSLVGRILTRPRGTSNEILSIDGGGVVRRTSGGSRQLLDIEIFRWAIERLLAGEVVTRKEINERYIKRGSSGIVLILSSLELFELTSAEGLDALRMTTASGA